MYNLKIKLLKAEASSWSFEGFLLLLLLLLSGMVPPGAKRGKDCQRSVPRQNDTTNQTWEVNRRTVQIIGTRTKSNHPQLLEMFEQKR